MKQGYLVHTARAKPRGDVPSLIDEFNPKFAHWVDTSAKQQATSIHPLPGWGKINTQNDEKK